MRLVDLPPVNTIGARENRLHEYFDTGLLGEDEFFVNPYQTARGAPKSLGDECNLPGPGSCIPRGYAKLVTRVRVRVVNSRPKDVFTVTVTGPCGDFGVARGQSRGAMRLNNTKTGKPFVLRLVELECFRVTVKGPDRLKGALTRVSLEGPLLSPLSG